MIQCIFKLFVLRFLKIPKQAFIQLFRCQCGFQIQEKLYFIVTFLSGNIFGIKAAGGQNQRTADTKVGKQHLSEAFVPGLLPTLHPDLHIFKR